MNRLPLPPAPARSATRMAKSSPGARGRATPLLVLLGGLLLLGPVAAGQYPPTRPTSPLLDPASPAEQPVQVRLLSDVAEIRPKMRFHVIVRFDLAREWTIHWRNPGDLPLGATKVKVDAPAGFVVSKPDWSGPMGRVTRAGLAEYVYHTQAAVVYEITAPQVLDGVEQATFTARTEWTAANQTTLQGQAQVTLVLAIANEDDDEDAVQAGPQQTEALNILAHLPAEAKELGLELSAVWDHGDLILETPGADLLTFFPHDSEHWRMDNAAAAIDHPGPSLRLQVRALRPQPQEPFTGVLGIGTKADRRVKWTYLKFTAPPKQIDE